MRFYPVFAVLALLTANLPVHGHPSAPPLLTAEQWREDLQFMANELRTRHANLYHQVSKADFESAVADLDQRIPQLERNDIIVGMMRIAAMIGDGHTRIEPRKDKAFNFHSLPMKLYLFDDGLWIRAVAPGHERLLGARIEAIGGVPIAQAIERVSALASAENRHGKKLYVPIYLAMPDILEAVGLSDSRERANLTLNRDGKSWSEDIIAGEVADLWPPDTDASFLTPDGWVDARKGEQPLWLQDPLDYHRLVALPDRSAVYAQLNMVTDTRESSLEAFGRSILEAAEKHNPSAVVLDLRLNLGGNGDLRNAFIPSLIRAEDADTRLFVLTARGTFSASQFILDDLDRLTGAVIIGEPASSRPTGYGDSFKSVMPNSGISVRASIKYWQSGQDMRDWTPVDLAPSYRFADYVVGRDPALDAALTFKPDQLLEQRLRDAAGKGASAIAATTDDPQYRYADVERAAQRVAIDLFRAKKMDAALDLARWSAARFPESTDSATVLALIADAAGRAEEAKGAARAAIRLDPNNRSVQSVLGKGS